MFIKFSVSNMHWSIDCLKTCSHFLSPAYMCHSKGLYIFSLFTSCCLVQVSPYPGPEDRLVQPMTPLETDTLASLSQVKHNSYILVLADRNYI